jgi:diaminopimelate decarboxylase
VHGNNKSVAELSASLDAGVGAVVLDSFTEIARLDELARARDVVADVMVRVTVGVEAHTHEFIATAHEDQKFGFSLAAGDAAEAVRRVLKSDGLHLMGLHSHIGSQIFDADGFELAARRVVALLADLRAEHGDDALDDLHTVDLGGGMGIAYTEADHPPSPVWLAAELRAIVDRECARVGIAPPRIAVEPGRAIAGPGTVTVYEVGTVKDVELGGGARRRYVSIDGGMSDNIRTALYGADYDCRVVSRSTGSAPAVRARVVGKHCESGDVVVRDCWLPADIAPGDLVAVAATGAYCYSMASAYNKVPRPAVVAVTEGTSRVVLRRETLDDLSRLEVSP